jgi:hypothetical protein
MAYNLLWVRHFVFHGVALQFPNGHRIIPAAPHTGLLTGMVAHVAAHPRKGIVPANHEQGLFGLAGIEQLNIGSHLLSDGTRSLAGREGLPGQEIAIRVYRAPGGVRLGSKL